MGPQKRTFQYSSLPREGETTVRGYLNVAKPFLGLSLISQEQ